MSQPWENHALLPFLKGLRWGSELQPVAHLFKSRIGMCAFTHELPVAVFVIQRQSWELRGYLALHREIASPSSR